MYFHVSLMKQYKRYTLNKRYVEGSIAESYLVDESVMYCMEYMPNSSVGTHKSSRKDWLEESEDLTDEQPLGTGHVMELNHVQFQQVRRWVLNRYENLEEWRW